MDSRKIARFIGKANRRLKLQYLSKTLQISIGFGLASALFVTLFSRLSFFPYYGFYAYLAAALIGATVFGVRISKIPRREQAISELDQYTPHNRLLTLSQMPLGTPLAEDLARKTEGDIHNSYQLFRQEADGWFSAKWLLISLALAVVLVISALFPAETQLSAKDREQELEIIEEMIEEVEKIKEQAESPEVRKELERLEKELGESDTAEQALRELVKKQKELALKQQQKEQDDNENAGQEAEDLERASSQLAKEAGETQTALSEMGKPLAFDLQQSIAANELSENDQETTDSETGNSGGQPESNGEGKEENKSTDETDGDAGEGSSSEEDSEQTAGDSQGEESSEGSNEGSSEGSNEPQDGQGDSGSSSGTGSSAAGEGTGQGSGQGDRELLSIPSRIGGTGETTVDDGSLSEGDTESYVEGPVDAERGTVRPYREVVGSYSDSYFSSAERLRLPPDLQKIVEQYFSSISDD